MYDFFKLHFSCYLTLYYKLFAQNLTFFGTVFLDYLCIIFTLPFSFPVLILTNQLFNRIILFLYSFEAKVKKNSFKHVRSHERVNYQWNFTDEIQDSVTTMAGCISISISHLWNFNQNWIHNWKNPLFFCTKYI